MPLARLPEGTPQLDVAALMREALDSQQAGEDIDNALRRVLQGKDLPGVDMIYQSIGDCLRMHEWRLGMSREQAARQLAQAETRLSITPDGKPYLESFVTNISGLESVPAHLRPQVLAQLQQQLRDGKTGPIILPTEGAAVKPVWLAALGVLVLSFLAAAYLFGLFH
jgi:hypothetical protein